MTDRQLCEMYDRTEHKTSAIVRAMYQEQCTLADIVRRLKKLGYKPERSLRYTFGYSLPEQISETRLREFAARKKIPTAPGTERKRKKTGMISAYCNGCFYLSTDYGDKSCGYISIEQRRRGCPAGEGCIRRKVEGKNVKLNKIKILVRQAKRAILLTEHTEAGEFRRQWISTGSAAYVLKGLPPLNTDNLPTILGLDGAALSKMAISADTFPADIDTGDYDAREKALLQLPCTVGLNGRELWLYRTDFQVWALDAAELVPIMGKAPKVCIRHTAAGDMLTFAVFDGLFLEGILTRDWRSTLDAASAQGQDMWLNWMGLRKPSEEKPDADGV